MKKLISSLALVLGSTFAFANSDQIRVFPAESENTIVSGSRESSQEGLQGYETAAFKVDCTVKGTITIIFNDGTQMVLKDAYITFSGVSCGQLLRELMTAP